MPITTTAATPGATEPWQMVDAPTAGMTPDLDSDHGADDAALLAAHPASTALRVFLYRSQTAPNGALTMKIVSHGQALALGHAAEVLDRLGLPLLDYRSRHFRHGAASATVQTLALAGLTQATHDRGALDQSALDQLAAALRSALAGDAESDGFTRLIFSAGITLKESRLLRALAHYWHQLGCVFASDAIAAALLAQPAASRALLAWFTARFDPAESDRDARTSHLAAAAQSSIASLSGNDERRIFAGLANLLGAVVRTNFFQRDAAGRDKDYLALKFACAAVDGMPEPRPLFEIFVHSARMAGVHLRGGKVARGGLRWSDRLHDFRTEVLGLFKAQMVKNVVIVPEGAKGGFVVKQPPAGGDALRQAGIACYSTLIRGLLDVTDNLCDGRVVPPPQVVRHDDDDPYLVVAADKGTATFSDIANQISAAYGFWLGDAFASGGSVGYDHKQLGITARGAWEAVKRHFRELGVDASGEPLTVIGVGDMSGDVFGNGLLMSAQQQLLGAFDHRHIFIDPQPLATAFTERQRLFALPASSWADFAAACLGPGGAVYPRNADSVPLSPEAQQRFGLPATATPTALIQALLQAEVDLLWLGGIGTYVRAAGESDEQVGDRNNNAIRIEERQLRCRVVGEGANLGLTQRARSEAAQHGVRLNTDAIDNAGGVSCSDHEVNIKILLDSVLADGQLAASERHALLASMSGETCGLVLRDIQLQTQALSVASARAATDLDRHRRLIAFFERRGQLERGLAGLPADADLAARQALGQGLTRPELSVLLAHTKIALFGEFIASTLPDDALLEHDLLGYFPTPLRQRFAAAIRRHPLRREIITTAVVNSMVNRVGSGFVNDIYERTGAADAEVARAYLVSRELFGLEDCWCAIEALDTPANSASHIALLLASREIAELATLWLLRHQAAPIDISSTVAALRPLLAEAQSAALLQDGSPLAEAAAAYRQRLTLAGAPPALVEHMTRLWLLAGNLDLLSLAASQGLPLPPVLRAVDALREHLHLPALGELLASAPCSSPREASARTWLREVAGSVPIQLLRRHPLPADADSAAWLQQLLAGRQATLALYRRRYQDLTSQDQGDLAATVLVAAALRELVAEAA